MVALEPARDHARVDVAAEAQLEPDPAPRDLPLDVLAEVDDVAQPPRRPRQDLRELPGAAGALGLAEVDRDAQPEPPRLGEGVPEDGHVLLPRHAVAPGRRVATQIDADDAAVAELRGQADRLAGLGRGVPAVDGEDEARAHGPRRARRARGLEGGDGGEDGGHVDRGRLRGGRGQGARGGAQLEVGHAVCVEVLEHREGRRAERLRVGDEVVDVGREEGEEPG